MCLCGLVVVSRALLSDTCGVVMLRVLCVACGRGLKLMCLYVVVVMYCVMVHCLCLCVVCVCVAASVNVLACGVCGFVFDAVWFAVVCDGLCVCCVCLMCVMCL